MREKLANHFSIDLVESLLNCGATDAYSSLFVSVCVCLLPGYRIVHSKLSPDTSTTGRNIFSELYDKLLVLKLRL